MRLSPRTFIGEKISVEFDRPLPFGKRPSCPDGFFWREREYRIIASLEEWVDFTRHGRMARNMSTEHAVVAERRGSWGVGRYHFHVRVEDGQLFHIYYDRTPKDVDNQMGEWFLMADLIENTPDSQEISSNY